MTQAVPKGFVVSNNEDLKNVIVFKLSADVNDGDYVSIQDYILEVDPETMEVKDQFKFKLLQLATETRTNSLDEDYYYGLESLLGDNGLVGYDGGSWEISHTTEINGITYYDGNGNGKDLNWDRSKEYDLDIEEFVESIREMVEEEYGVE